MRYAKALLKALLSAGYWWIVILTMNLSAFGDRIGGGPKTFWEASGLPLTVLAVGVIIYSLVLYTVERLGRH